MKVMVFLVLAFLFRFARFGRFGCFGGFVSVVSAVSLVSFRWFRFVVSGFSTCHSLTPRRKLRSIRLCVIMWPFLDVFIAARQSNKKKMLVVLLHPRKWCKNYGSSVIKKIVFS